MTASESVDGVEAAEEEDVPSEAAILTTFFGRPNRRLRQTFDQ